MCIVSQVGDHYSDKIRDDYPTIFPGTFGVSYSSPYVSQTEFYELKKLVLEMKEVLIAAKLIDQKTNQADCEMEDKVALLKKVAEMVGVDLEEVFGKNEV